MSDFYVTLEPGQFLTRWGSKCAECGDFMKKDSVAGYNEDDEIVCEDCWVPFHDR